MIHRSERYAPSRPEYNKIYELHLPNPRPAESACGHDAFARDVFVCNTLVRSTFVHNSFFWGGLSALVFTANAHIVIPNVMHRPAPNTIKYTNFTCRTVGRRNRHAGTTPSSAVVRPPFTFRRSYRRRHRLVSFSSKSFRFGDVAALPIRSPRSVTDEYWYVASAAPIVRRSGGRVLTSRAGCGEVRESIIAIRRLFAGRSGNLTIRRLRRTDRAAEWRAGQLRYTPQIALNTTPK